jgi:hypothetical protein
VSTEDDGFGGKFRAIYVGVVTENADPLKVGRVRLRIPGLLEKSDWALPLGAVGGGTHRRGFYDPPDVGAEVAVFFHAGDPDKPCFLPGAWGAPGGVRETPGPVGGYATPLYSGAPGKPEEISPEDAPKVKSYETARWIMVFDDRAGKERLFIEDKKTGDHLLFDGVKSQVELRVTTLLRIVVDGICSINANQLTLNDRPVLPTSKPIG